MMDEIVGVEYWDKQVQGNNMIRIRRKDKMAWFKKYKLFVLEPLNDNIIDYRNELYRRYYVEDVHIEHMRDDPRIDLTRGYVWTKKK